MARTIPTLAAALLMTALATPVFAQAAVQEPGLYAFYHPNSDVLNAGRGGVRPYDANAYYNVVPTQPRNSTIAPRHHRKQ
jgi:hypothetical protein